MSQALPRPNVGPTPAPRAQPSLGFLRRRWRAATRLFNRLNGITPAEVYREDIDELLRPTFTWDDEYLAVSRIYELSSIGRGVKWDRL